MLRQLNYREFYHPNMSISESRDWQVHADHCIEFLRASAMCHPDVSSLTTFVWNSEKLKPMLRNERPIHSCVDWLSLTRSLQDRFVEGREIEDIAHLN